VENYQGNLRYDHFIKSLAPFLSVSGRRDRFQGLDFRLNIDPGLAYYFVDRAKLQFWGELGYDLQHDVRSEDAIDVALVEGSPVDKTETRHSIRGYVGYQNEVNPFMTFKTGLEYLQAVVEPENYRLNWDLGLSSKIAGNFSMATTFSVKYDNNPLPEIEKTDIVTAINLVYGLL
jgi:putative salt-induced outer membrane protein